MAQKGLFFNAFPNADYETGYDRNYSADDISDWLKVVITTGIIKTGSNDTSGKPTGMKVVANTGMNIRVNAGMGCTQGKPYINDAQISVNIDTAPTGSNPRYDAIVLRMNNTQTVDGRRTYITKRSFDAVPTLANLTRNDSYYDLLLGYVVVNPNVTSIQQTDIVDTRGDEELCPWVTAVKGYGDYYDAIIQRYEYDTTLSTSSTSVITDLAATLYNNKYSLISVYVNGLREDEDNYTIGTSSGFITITFTTTKNAGADVSVILNNFVDGEGLSNVLDDYNNWVNDVENLKTLNENVYVCNGVNDNVQISNLVNEALAKEGSYYQTIRIVVVGSFGITAAAGGDGSSANPYGIFNFDTNAGARKIELDFTRANNLTINVTSNAQTILFKGNNMRIIGGTFVINNQANGTSIQVFGDVARVRADDSRFYIYGYSNTLIAYSGTFNNCKGIVRNITGNSYCFNPSNSKVLNIVGGEYMAYTQQSGSKSATVGSSNSNAVTTMTNVCCPTSALSGYQTQSNSIYHTSGKLSCFGLISALAVTSTTGATITGTIAVSVYNTVW